jgi:hypothetical protein
MERKHNQGHHFRICGVLCVSYLSDACYMFRLFPTPPLNYVYNFGIEYFQWTYGGSQPTQTVVMVIAEEGVQ